MSWFDTAGFTSFAKSALNTAQKTIDKALDIKDHNNPNNPGNVKPDAESFFEAFGIGAKIPQLKLPSPKPHVEAEATSSSHNQPPNSGFWSDTWESFFEADKSLSDVLEEGGETNTVSPGSPQKTVLRERGCNSESAVSSQPVRSSLFPGNVAISASSECIARQGSHVPPEVASVRESKSSPWSSNKDSGNLSSTGLPLIQQPSSLKDIVQQQRTVPSPQPNYATSCDSFLEEISLQDDGLCDRSEECLSKNVNISVLTLGEIPEAADCRERTKFPIEYDVVDLSETCLEGSPIPHDSYAVSQSSDLYSHTVQGSYINISGREGTTECGSNDEMSSDVPLIQCDSEDPLDFNESFHILNPCVVSDWIASKDMVGTEDSVHGSESTDETNSRNVDSQSNSSKDESETDVRECDVKSSVSGGSHEMSGSFVKCSIEETECGSHRGQSPLSTTTSEQSDGTKLESEQNTSGDEIETTTSSDIEILSAPTNGDNDRTSSHTWVPRILRIRRSESPSSDCSKDSSMPVLREVEELKSSEDNQDRSHQRKLFEGMDMEKLMQQQDQLQVLLEAREKKVLELSQDNLKLRENVDSLQSDVFEAKTAQAKDSQIVSAMTKECTQRLAQMEGQLLKVSKERDVFRSQYDDIQSEMAQRIRVTEMDEIIKDKDLQIKELMDEGEKLSKKELTHTTIIKKLRIKEEDMEHSIKSLKEKLDENSKEVDRLRKSLGAKDEQEKKHIDAIRQLTSTVSKHEKEIATLQSGLEDASEKELGQKKSLEETFRELTELQKSSEMKDAEIQKLTLSVQMAAKEQLREGLDHANKEKESLSTQIEDLRKNMKQNEEQSSRREKSLNEDIARLQMRLQESEDRNEKLTKDISTATRPAVRQIEILQASYNAQIASSEKIERNLTDRLSDIQSQLALCSERERLANEKCLKMNLGFTKLETENALLRQEKLKLNSMIEGLNTRLSFLEENTNRDSEHVTHLKHNFTIEANKLKEEKDKISQEMQKVLEQLKDSKLQIQNLQDELKHKDYKIQSLANLSRSTSPNASLRSSVDSINNWIQDEVPERRISTPINNYRMSVYESLRTGCAASVLENLQSQLKQREGEIAQLQCEITKLERERESIAQDLGEITTQNEDLQQNLENLSDVEKNFKELNQKYNTLLQMYGEKVEQNEELRLDLSDVKSMYKAQIEELLQK